MDLRHTQHQRTAENIAQQDTPGYKARRMDFQDALRQAAAGNGGSMAPKATHPGHMGVGAGSNRYDSVQATESMVTKGAKNDGNTVAPEEEMAKLAENTLLYDTASQIIAAKYRGLRGIIREGR
jgi:flagellar basal-body rod protein FlgB